MVVMAAATCICTLGDACRGSCSGCGTSCSCVLRGPTCAGCVDHLHWETVAFASVLTSPKDT